METRHSDHDGSDIFWPGYVDATTNLILNLLFLLTILIVAVFMFALELGRTSQEEHEALPVAVVEPAPEPDISVLVEKNTALNLELQRMKKLLAEKEAKLKKAESFAKIFEASANVAKPASGLESALASNFELMVRFKDEAVVFTPEEHDQLLESLQPVVKSEKVSLYVEVPVGFSEAKRMGFYRAMSVRNLLIEMKLATEKINVTVVEGTKDANASVVRVRSY